MKKLLFLGCNHDQVPYLMAAKKAGYRVVATDLNKDAPGVVLADAWYPASYEDVPTLVEIGKKEGFTASDKVFTAGSQFAYIGASGFAEAFGIPFIPHKSVLLCLDKTALYPFFEKYGLIVPTWRLYDGASSLDAARAEFGTVFLKSDFGKSPRYCYRLPEGSAVPLLPNGFDRYYRKAFLMQKEIVGTHYRINCVGTTLYVFNKETDSVSRPDPGFSLGPSKEPVMALLESLSLTRHLVKFDVIKADDTLYFIDIGLEPPSRLTAYLTHCGHDFPKLYVEHLLEGKVGYPDPASLPSDCVVRGAEVTCGV